MLQYKKLVNMDIFKLFSSNFLTLQCHKSKKPQLNIREYSNLGLELGLA